MAEKAEYKDRVGLEKIGDKGMYGVERSGEREEESGKTSSRPKDDEGGVGGNLGESCGGDLPGVEDSRSGALSVEKGKGRAMEDRGGRLDGDLSHVSRVSERGTLGRKEKAGGRRKKPKKVKDTSLEHLVEASGVEDRQRVWGNIDKTLTELLVEVKDIIVLLKERQSEPSLVGMAFKWIGDGLAIQCLVWGAVEFLLSYFANLSAARTSLHMDSQEPSITPASKTANPQSNAPTTAPNIATSNASQYVDNTIQNVFIALALAAVIGSVLWKSGGG